MIAATGASADGRENRMLIGFTHIERPTDMKTLMFLSNLFGLKVRFAIISALLQ